MRRLLKHPRRRFEPFEVEGKMGFAGHQVDNAVSGLADGHVAARLLPNELDFRPTQGQNAQSRHDPGTEGGQSRPVSTNRENNRVCVL
jgi:hypothetical protein